MPSLYMETTKIAAMKTAAEITALLVSSGAKRIMQDFDDDGEVSALTFSIMIDGNEVPFRLPINDEPIFKIINGRRAPQNRTKNVDADGEQAVRVAWRQVLRWIQAQIALVETGMVTIQEVMLPYTLVKDGTTLYQQIQTRGWLKALPAPVDE